MFKKEIRLPILALFFLSLGGLLIHLHVHPPGDEAFDWIPVVCGFITAFVLPFLFNRRSTVGLAFVITLAVVIVGTVTMAYESIEHFKPEEVKGALAFLQFWLIKSTLADILVLFAKVPLALMILRHFRSTAD